ncbi:MAG: putative capsular polysaccharide synthesis family protein [Cyanobacteria bacterium P01_A01_bin.123]
MESPKILFQKILRSNYHFARAYHHLKVLFLDSSTNKQPIVVHQMGKVASTAIYESLKTLNPDPDKYSIYHTHYLSDPGLHKSEGFYRENYSRIQAIHTPLIHSFYIRRYLKQSKREKLKVITLTRDPVAKNISSFFQNLEYLFGFSLREKIKTDNMESILDELKRLFLEEFSYHDVPLSWFDLEMKPTFGIDVFSIPFDMERGYQICEGEQADVLILKLEVLNQVVAEAFNIFLGIKDFEVKSENIGADKSYAQCYKLFKKTLSLPESYLDKMYLSKYVNHFYSKAEISAFREERVGGS